MFRSKESDIPPGPIAEVDETGVHFRLRSGEAIRVIYPGRPIFCNLASDRGFLAYPLEIGAVSDLQNLPFDYVNVDFLIIKRPRGPLFETTPLFAYKGLRSNERVILGSDPKLREIFTDIPLHLASRAVMIGRGIEPGRADVITFKNLAAINQPISVSIKYPSK